MYVICPLYDDPPPHALPSPPPRRLERLAEARSLASFEKQVLLLLVGCRVSPSVMRTLTMCVTSGFGGGAGAVRRTAGREGGRGAPQGHGGLHNGCMRTFPFTAT